LIEKFDIAGYCRISVDDELSRDNTSIENQKAIIEDYVNKHFPDSTLTFYEDRDRSGYTFAQRESYQRMRQELVTHKKDILIVKDFSRFSRRNSRGLVELEDLRDAGARIISIGDGIDFPSEDDWLKIQFQFLINEMPVTDTSKKVKSVIKRRQADGKWICAAPYGYIINKQQQFEICPTEADVVRMIFDLYNDGDGYKKIANKLTGMGIPTPRMSERDRKEADGTEYKRKVRPEWSIITIQNILDNDFYIGTLRQGKYTRAKINGKDVKRNIEEQIVIENHHQPIIDYRTFAITRENRKKRSTSNYRGVKKYANTYTGFLICGDCGAPMFSMSRADLRPAYTCGTYHRQGLKGCTSHHIRVETLDEVIKAYIRTVSENSAAMLDQLNADLAKEHQDIDVMENAGANLADLIEQLKEELKATKRQRIRDIMKHPEQELLLEETYDEMELELTKKIQGLEHQLEMTLDKRNTIIRVNRTAKTAIDVFNDILQKPALDKNDLELIIEQIAVYEDHINVKLKADIDSIIKCGTLPEDAVNFNDDIVETPFTLIQRAIKHMDKVYDVNVISDGDPLEIFTDHDGGIILKKYSPIGELSEYAAAFSSALYNGFQVNAAISDRDHIIACAGQKRKEHAEHRISSELEQAITQRRTVMQTQVQGYTMPIIQGEDANAWYAVLVVPIVSQGDAIGAVLLYTKDSTQLIGQPEVKSAELIALFLGKQME